MKTCTKCGEEKSPEEYSKDKTGKDGLRARCKACEKKIKASYYSQPEIKRRTAAQRREYYHANRDQILAQKAGYYAMNRDAIIPKMAGHHAANPHLRWASGYRSRSRQYGFEPIVEDFRKADVIAIHGDACVDCGGPFDELDHVIPVRLGGTHTLNNVEPVCAEHNKRRWGEYMAEVFDIMAHIYTGGQAA